MGGLAKIGGIKKGARAIDVQVLNRSYADATWLCIERVSEVLDNACQDTRQLQTDSRFESQVQQLNYPRELPTFSCHSSCSCLK